MTEIQQVWLDKLDQIGDRLAEQGKAAEDKNEFVAENYALLREQKFFSAMVPSEFGGGGANFPTMCAILEKMAGYSPSTALSFSMHQHIIAANVFNHMNGKPGQALLEKVAANELVLISTGGGDWLSSSGNLEKTDGGYLMSGMKHFCSGSPAGNLFVTSAPYACPKNGDQVFHFPVPANAEGVTILDNWNAHGMRGTGSCSVKFENVFVPEESVAAKRPRGDFHSVWAVVLPVALTLIMCVYRGIAEKGAEIARTKGAGFPVKDPSMPYIMGEMENQLTITRISVDSMIAMVDNWNYEAGLETSNEILKRKAIAALAAKETLSKAVESLGGLGFIVPTGLEALMRDAAASAFHPLQDKRQHFFTGTVALGEEPPHQAY